MLLPVLILNKNILNGKDKIIKLTINNKEKEIKIDISRKILSYNNMIIIEIK